jgi:hypothetical protein
VLKTSLAETTSADEPPVLPPPNIVDGAAAALLSLCQARGVSARATVSYRAQGGSMRGSDAGAFAAFDGTIAAAVRCGAPVLPADKIAERRAAAVSQAWSSSPSTGGMMYM